MFRQALSSTETFASLVTSDASSRRNFQSSGNAAAAVVHVSSDRGALFGSDADECPRTVSQGSRVWETGRQDQNGSLGATTSTRFARQMEKAAAYERRQAEKRDAALDALLPRNEDCYDPELPHLLRDPLQDVLQEGRDEEEAAARTSSRNMQSVRHPERVNHRRSSSSSLLGGVGGSGCMDQREADVAHALMRFLDRQYAPTTRPSSSGQPCERGAPEGAVLVFDTSVLLSCSRWCDVLDVLLRLGNTIVVPPVVLNELDHHVKKYRRALDSVSLEGREGQCGGKRYREEVEDNDGGSAAVGGGGGNGRYRDQQQQHSLMALGQRSLVLRDWLSVQMHDALVAEEGTMVAQHKHGSENGAEQVGSAETIRVRRTYAKGRVVCANHQDSEVVARRAHAGATALGLHPPQPLIVRNNDDSIMYVAMFLRRIFLLSTAPQPATTPVGTRGVVVEAHPTPRRPVLLLTDDRILAIKARAEGVAVASATQLLNWS